MIKKQGMIYYWIYTIIVLPLTALSLLATSTYITYSITPSIVISIILLILTVATNCELLRKTRTGYVLNNILLLCLIVYSIISHFMIYRYGYSYNIYLLLGSLTGRLVVIVLQLIYFYKRQNIFENSVEKEVKKHYDTYISIANIIRSNTKKHCDDLLANYQYLAEKTQEVKMYSLFYECLIFEDAAKIAEVKALSIKSIIHITFSESLKNKAGMIKLYNQHEKEREYYAATSNRFLLPENFDYAERFYELICHGNNEEKQKFVTDEQNRFDKVFESYIYLIKERLMNIPELK